VTLELGGLFEGCHVPMYIFAITLLTLMILELVDVFEVDDRVHSTHLAILLPA
jgi:hypothetical protein